MYSSVTFNQHSSTKWSWHDAYPTDMGYADWNRVRMSTTSQHKISALRERKLLQALSIYAIIPKTKCSHETQSYNTILITLHTRDDKLLATVGSTSKHQANWQFTGDAKHLAWHEQCPMKDDKCQAGLVPYLQEVQFSAAMQTVKPQWWIYKHTLGAMNRASSSITG